VKIAILGTRGIPAAYGGFETVSLTALSALDSVFRGYDAIWVGDKYRN